MEDEKLEKIMAAWASRAEAAAPQLHPPEQLRRRVAARRRSVAILPRVIGWAAAVAALIVLGFWLRGLLAPSEPHLRLQGLGPDEPVAFEGAVLLGQKGGRGAKGGGRGARVSPAQLVFQSHGQGSKTAEGIDLLAPGAGRVRLDAGDCFRLGLRLAADRHLYIFQLHARTGVERLFPNAEYSAAANPLRAGASHYVPAAPNWLCLAESRGEERIYTITAQRALPDLDALFARVTQARKSHRGQAAQRLRDRLESFRAVGGNDVQVVVFSFNGP